MIKSMTGFGSTNISTKSGKITIEINSTNRKFLEISTNLPREFSSFEIDIKKQISKIVFRGHVVINISLYPNLDDENSLLPNIEYLKKLKQAWVKTALEIDVDPKSIDIPFLAKISKNTSLLPTNSEHDLDELLKGIGEALLNLMKMKVLEGKNIEKDVLKRLNLIEDNVSSIKDLSSDAPQKHKEKLKAKLEEHFANMTDNDDRILREIALIAEKLDIAEEILRLYSHIEQFKKALKLEEKTIGRKLDFLIQEMMREINTISAKSSNEKISIHVIDIKSELEKIREQIQNVE
jgi:uncharacterized protein (TIGR00255 family)